MAKLQRLSAFVVGVLVAVAVELFANVCHGEDTVEEVHGNKN